MPAGRPRTVSPPPEELEKLVQQMIDWVIQNRPLHLSEWWSGEMFIIEKVWDTICRAPEFFPYYEKALRIIGIQYLDKDSSVRDNISQRWQRVYFKDLKRSEDEDKIFESQLKKEENKISAQTLAEIMKNPSDISQK